MSGTSAALFISGHKAFKAMNNVELGHWKKRHQKVLLQAHH
jgi:hypothetical protein